MDEIKKKYYGSLKEKWLETLGYKIIETNYKVNDSSINAAENTIDIIANNKTNEEDKIFMRVKIVEPGIPISITSLELEQIKFFAKSQNRIPCYSFIRTSEDESTIASTYPRTDIK